MTTSNSPALEIGDEPSSSRNANALKYTRFQVKTGIWFLFALSSACFNVRAEKAAFKLENVKNSPIIATLPTKCKTNHYVWAGTWDKGSKTTHNLSVEKEINSTPFEVILLLSKDKLMVDNVAFNIIRQDKDEIFALTIDANNVLVVNLLLNQGKVVYTKAFANSNTLLGTGKNNSMSFVADCQNY